MKLKSPRNSTLLKLAASAFLSGAALATSGWMYASKIEPGWLEITTHSLILPRLDPAFDNYRIIQISDIHMETWMTQKRLAEVVKTTNLLRGDLIAITGDFVTDLYHRTSADLVDNLSKLKAPDGVSQSLAITITGPT